VCESAVLLKNEGILPIRQEMSIAIVGEFAEKPRYQGAGSSRINPHKITNALSVMTADGIGYEYARGYDLLGKVDPDELILDAVEVAKGKDVVIVFAGLPDEYESEGFDRVNIDLPHEHNALIEQIAKVNPNIVVVLHNGSAVRLPWVEAVNAILLLGLGGQCVGAAAVDLLFGKTNPSGKLSETYPLSLLDNPSYNHFGQRLFTEYRESIYVGYRYYDKANKPVQYPFGHGLSYTAFEYSDLVLSKTARKANETLEVMVKVKNTGRVAGKEVVQIYVSPPESRIFKPEKELREFAKLALEPGEEKTLTFSLGKRAFAYWNININNWHVESGIYQILVGSSSRDIRLSAEVEIFSSQADAAIPDYRKKAPMYYDLPVGTLDIPQSQFEVLYGQEVPSGEQDAKPPFTRLSTLNDARNTFVGRFLINIFKFQMRKLTDSNGEQDESMLRMMECTMLDFPLRSFGMWGLSPEMVEGILDLLNKKYFKGFRKVMSANRQVKEN
jgi:beta-glucosidase